MKKFIFAILAIIALVCGYYQQQPSLLQKQTSEQNTDLLQMAYQQKLSNIQVQGHGQVIRVLPDDTRGTRHQRFLITTEGGLSLLIAHNIDLAPRIPSLHVGDTVQFSGEYEWNTQGGVIHWTHHDPRGRHENGWLRHNDRIYR